MFLEFSSRFGHDSLDEWKLDAVNDMVLKAQNSSEYIQTTTATSEPTSIAVGNNGVWTRGAVSRWLSRMKQFQPSYNDKDNY